MPGADREAETTPEFPRPSLREFVVEAFPLLTTAPRYVDNWHIHAICDHLTACSAGQIKKLIINLPPGFMKSVLCDVAWPAWEWIERPSRQFLFGTYHDWLSTRDSVATRNLIESNWYQARWGKRFKLASGSNEKRLFYNSRSGFRLATTVATGFAIGAHVDVSLIDDPIDPRRARSKVAQKNCLEWYDAGISGRGNVPEEYVRIVVHQRLGKKDLSGHLLAMGGWEHLVIPMHYNPKRSKVTSLGWKDPRTKEGELAWPELFPESVVKELRNALQTPGAIACQHEQDPMDSDVGMFTEDMFCWFEWIQDEELEKQLLRDRKIVRRIRGIFRLHHVDPDTNEETTVEDILADDCMFFEVYDTAMKDGQENDFTVGTVAFRTPTNRDLGFLNVKREKLKIPDQADFIIRQRAQFPYLSWDGVESKNSGIGLIQLFDRSGRPLRDFKADVDKVRRAQPLSTLCKRRKVFLLSGAPWVPEFVKEICVFPSADEHDDQVDTAAYAAQEYDNADNMGPRARKL